MTVRAVEVPAGEACPWILEPPSQRGGSRLAARRLVETHVPEAPLLIHRWYPFRGPHLVRPSAFYAATSRARPFTSAARWLRGATAGSRASCTRRTPRTTRRQVTGDDGAPATEDRRGSCCAQIAPYSPAVAPAMATVLFGASCLGAALTQSTRSSRLRGRPVVPGVTRRAHRRPRCGAGSRRSRGLDALLVEILVVVGDETEPVVHLDLDPVGASSAAAWARAVLYDPPEGCREEDLRCCLDRREVALGRPFPAGESLPGSGAFSSARTPCGRRCRADADSVVSIRVDPLRRTCPSARRAS